MLYVYNTSQGRDILEKYFEPEFYDEFTSVQSMDDFQPEMEHDSIVVCENRHRLNDDVIKRLRQNFPQTHLMILSKLKNINTQDHLYDGADQVQTIHDDVILKDNHYKAIRAFRTAGIRFINRMRTEGSIKFGPENNFTFDRKSARLRWKNKNIKIPYRQFNILEQLIKADSKVVSNNAIKTNVYHHTNVDDNEHNDIQNCISHLRRHFDKASGQEGMGKQIIQTVRGVGYRLMR